MANLLQINNLIVSFGDPQGKTPAAGLRGKTPGASWQSEAAEADPQSGQGELIAVKGVSLHLDAGETLALVGESGCGKTVLCKSMLKILCEKGRIRQGEIFLDGTDLAPVSEREMQKYRGSDIAMVFQDPATSLDPAFAVGEQIAEVLRLHAGLSRADAKAQALELMEMVQIPDAERRYHQRPYQFSGGMRQRIAIAIALAGEPKLLLADEPTTALDEETQEEILALLKSVQRKTGAAILFITHDLSLVEEMAERVAIMQDGRIVETGSVEAVFAAPQHAYTKKLLGYLDYKKGRGHHHRGATGGVTGTVRVDGPGAAGAWGQDGAADGISGKDGAVADVPVQDPVATRQPILSVERLCKSFHLGKQEKITVLQDFSMELYRGEIVGLVGRSGCGKSTLARCIMGIERPDSGEIHVGDGQQEMINMQMIFQDSQSAFNDRMTVEQIIAEPLKIMGKLGRKRGSGDALTTAPIKGSGVYGSIPAHIGRAAADSIQDAVYSAMKAVELEPADFACRKPYELSGGQRQRVAIARALITDPDIIIADEPLTGLDVTAQAQIVHLLKKLAEERGLTILFIAHDLPMVNHISDQYVLMPLKS